MIVATVVAITVQNCYVIAVVIVAVVVVAAAS